MKSDSFRKTYKVIMLIILTALITFLLTSVAYYNKTKNTDTNNNTSALSELNRRISYYREYIDKFYIYDIDENKMTNEAIKGYFSGLGDDYSEYIPKDEMQNYLADATGKYVGIGVYIINDSKTNRIIVISPMKGSPAEEAGIKPGDAIIKVDGKEYTGDELSEASDKLKGEENTKVKVQILREENKIIDLEITRKSIKVNHIESKVINDNIGYIQIASFDEESKKEFIDAYEELKGKNIKSLILDLRNNGGGIVDEATEIADLFVDKGKTLLITKSKTDKEKITKAKKAKEINLPIVILINEGSASASEILTAAIKENIETTKVVGTKTYGKGVIQSIFTLLDGSGIKLTTEEYFSPKHNTINKVGITPDYIVELEKGQSSLIIDEKNDAQLQKAIELLK